MTGELKITFDQAQLHDAGVVALAPNGDDPYTPAELRAALAEGDELKKERAAIEYAAHMPADYEYGLPSWINQRLYACWIGLELSPHIRDEIVKVHEQRDAAWAERDAWKARAARWKRAAETNRAQFRVADSIIDMLREDCAALRAQVRPLESERDALRARVAELEEEREKLKAQFEVDLVLAPWSLERNEQGYYMRRGEALRTRGYYPTPEEARAVAYACEVWHRQKLEASLSSSAARAAAGEAE